MDQIYSNNQHLSNLRNRLKSHNTQSSSLKLMLGTIDLSIGMEDHSHILTSYLVKLIDYGSDQAPIRCKRMVKKATFNGVGDYEPLEDGDMVVVAFREGMANSGIILGSFFLEGDIEKYAIDGEGLKPNTLDNNRKTNQPIVLPDRIATPDANFQVYGSKRTRGDYRDQALKYTKQEKLDSYSTPGSITMRDANGYYGNWSSNSQIFYSDRDIVLLCKADGTGKCERFKQEALIYKDLYQLFREAFIEENPEKENELREALDLQDSEEALTSQDNNSTEENVEAIATSTGISTSSIGIAIGEAIGQGIRSMLGDVVDQELINNEKEEDYLRNERSYAYLQGQLNPSHLQYADILYYVVELKKLATIFQQAADNCVESDLLFRNSVDDALAATDIRDRACDLIELEDCKIDINKLKEEIEKELGVIVQSLYLSQEDEDNLKSENNNSKSLILQTINNLIDLNLKMDEEIELKNPNLKIIYKDLLDRLIDNYEEYKLRVTNFLKDNNKEIKNENVSNKDLAKIHFKVFNSVIQETSNSGDSSLIWPMALEGNSACGAMCEYGYERSRLHKGIDIGGFGNGSDPDLVWAAASGKVRSVIMGNEPETYGNYVIISHSDGSETLYAHLASVAVTEGQDIKQKDKVGIRGDTGARFIHLHFEYYPNGGATGGISVDPRTVLPKPGLVNYETGKDNNNAPQ